jgi:hypothetical protein
MKSGRDVVRHLNDVLPWVGGAATVNPLQVSWEGGAIVDSGVYFGVNSRSWYLGVGVTKVCRREFRRRVDAETWFGIQIAESESEDADEDSRDESPEEAGKYDVIRELLLRTEFFINFSLVLL